MVPMSDPLGRTTVDPFGFDDSDIERLRARNNIKWHRYDPDVLPLWVAEMDYHTAPVVMDAVRRAVDEEQFGYPGSAPELREAYARFSAGRLDFAIDPGRCEVIPDVLTGIQVGIGVFTPADSPVIVTTPAYMPFLDLPGVCGRKRVDVPLVWSDTNGRWELDLDGIDAALAAGARGLILCQPYNPVGRIFTADELRALADVVAAHDGFVFSDEIHSPVILRGRHVAYASVSEVAASHTLTLAAASKGWSIPGLRTAIAVTHTDANWRTWEKHASPLRTHGAAPVGIAATTAAFTDGEPWLDAALDHIRGNQAWLVDFLASELPEVGHTPGDGTYFAWLDFRPLGISNPGQWLVEQARVALNEGRTFGAAGRGWVRLNLATARPILVEACERIRDAVHARTV